MLSTTNNQVKNGIFPYDIGLVNLQQAVGLPGSERLNVPACVRWIDEAARLVKNQTEAHFYQFRENPLSFDCSEGVFRMMWLTSVLQRDLHVRYRMEIINHDDPAFFSRSRKPVFAWHH